MSRIKTLKLFKSFTEWREHVKGGERNQKEDALETRPVFIQ
jgi:hypothetical protein